MTPLRPWRQNFAAVFGVMTDANARVWEQYLNDCLNPRPTISEMDHGMVTLCNRKTEGGKPSVVAFAQAIRRNRNGSEAMSNELDQVAIAKAQRIIRYATTPAQVWAAVCTERLDINQREDLAEFARCARPDMFDACGVLIDFELVSVKLDEILKLEREGREAEARRKGKV